MLYTHNENELIDLGHRFGSLLKTGQVIILTGDLGAGKTTFTKGIAKGLGISQMIKSPTYTIVREYEGRIPLYHLDVYRIGDDPDSIDLDDFLYGDGICVIEWGELLTGLPSDYLEIKLTHFDNGRQIEILAHGNQSQALLEAFGNA